MSDCTYGVSFESNNPWAYSGYHITLDFHCSLNILVVMVALYDSPAFSCVVYALANQFLCLNSSLYCPIFRFFRENLSLPVYTVLPVPQYPTSEASTLSVSL